MQRETRYRSIRLKNVHFMLIWLNKLRGNDVEIHKVVGQTKILGAQTCKLYNC